MMKNLVILLFFLATITSCKTFKEATVIGVDSFFLNKINSEGIEAEIKLKIKNPNSMGFSIYPSEFDVIFSGIRMGKAKLKKRVHIGANSEQVYSFILKSKLDDFNIFDAARLLNLDNVGKIEVNGDLKAGKFYLKKKLSVNYIDKVNILK